MDSKNENDKVNMPSSLSPEPMIAYIDDLDFFKDFKDEFPAIAYNDLKSKSDLLIELSVYHGLTNITMKEYIRLEEEKAEDKVEHSIGKLPHMIWHLYHLGIRGTLGLDTRLRDMTREEKADARFGAYWQGSERVIPDKGDFRDYWIEISSDRDVLGPALSYVFIRDPVRRLCHRMIACSISGRGQEPKKVTGVDLFYLYNIDRGTTNVPYLLAQYLFRHAKGRKGGDRPLGGHFIGHLAAYFRLPDAVADAPGAAEDALAADEGAQADPAPVHAPQPPPLAPKIIQQKVSKLGEMLLDRSLIRADLPLGWSVV
ncbi:hypothetical protein Tco_0047034 [Tanacetum coccineum]